MDKKINDLFDKSVIGDIVSKAAPVNALKNIDNYNDEMTISQVVRFFERQGISFTKTMIQNYVRVGLIPPPADKRYYLKEHLILLTMIDSLKDIYSLEEIGSSFKTVLNDINTFEDDIIDMGEVYNEYISLYENAVSEWTVKLKEIVSHAHEKAKGAAPVEEEQKKVAYFLTILSLMTHSIATRQIAKSLMELYTETTE